MAEDIAARAVEVVTVQVAKMALGPGDVLLVKVPKQFDTPETWEAANDALAAAFPRNRVFLATDDIEFSVIKGAAFPQK